ncbi:conserved hypothetical protein [Ricinus communis]|uniref:Uncharacterized protein n=1 Tax=Ricinus communis TaxID=3988 RepID=B9RAP5_RICCO|nr:conserved hypothetical protein [Ricinus communis]
MAVAGAKLSMLSSCDSAMAAQQIADIAESDNRGFALLLPIILAILWVLNNRSGKGRRVGNSPDPEQWYLEAEYGEGNLNNLAIYASPKDTMKVWFCRLKNVSPFFLLSLWKRNKNIRRGYKLGGFEIIVE